MKATDFQNRFTRPALFAAILISVLTAGCGGGGGSDSGAAPGGAVLAGAVAVPGIAGSAGASASDPTVGSASPANAATNVPTSVVSSNNVASRDDGVRDLHAGHESGDDCLHPRRDAADFHAEGSRERNQRPGNRGDERGEHRRDGSRRPLRP